MISLYASGPVYTAVAVELAFLLFVCVVLHSVGTVYSSVHVHIYRVYTVYTTH